MPIGYQIDGKAVKDLTDKDLTDYQKKFTETVANNSAVLNNNMNQLQMSIAVLNVVQYEIERRANTIQLAGLNDLPGGKKR